MTYATPILRPLDAAIACASCTPEPLPQERCPPLSIAFVDADGDGIPEVLVGGGTFVGSVNGTPTCLVPPNPADPGSNVAGTQAWLNCVLAGGC